MHRVRLLLNSLWKYIALFKVHYSTFKPTILAIELNNNCNAQCTMCGHHLQKRTIQQMEFGLFKKVIEEANDAGVIAYQLSFYGEPLLYPQLTEAVRFIKSLNSNAEIVLNTNAYYLSADKSKALLRAGVTMIKVSIDGNNKEEFEKIRKGLKWNTVKKNVVDLWRTIQDGQYNCKVHIRGLHLKNNRIDEESYQDMWGPYADKVQVRNEHELDTNAGESLLNKIYPCHRIYSQMIITSNGDATLCAYDWDGQEIYGNVKEKSLMQLWNSSYLIRKRLIHLLGLKRTLPLCNGCTYKIL